MYIPQKQLEKLRENALPNKVVVIYGPRRCGKTTLIKKFLAETTEPYILTTGEDITVREFLSSSSVERLKSFLGEKRLLVIDEAQKLPDIGLNLKLMVDHIAGIRIIATGSSAFDLAQKTGEPLLGRKHTLLLFPLAQLELSARENPHETRARLADRLVYGSYPEVITSAGNEAREKYLKELVGSALYKDILELDGIRHSDKLIRLLQLVAFQIGKEVSLSELGGQLGMSKNTVEKYLDLLEKSFVVFRLRGFSRNLRKEISKTSRYFFYDVGVRNAIINNWNPIAARDDAGALWENYVITERIKKQEYAGPSANNYFWRTHSRQEIDFVEERGGNLYGYEMKWSGENHIHRENTKEHTEGERGRARGAQRVKIPKDWQTAYPDASYEIITPENYLEFIA